MSNQVEIVAGLVSTIIPVYNRPEMILECVESVLNQTYRPIEIIIVDDGSSDNTPAVLKQLAEQHSEIQVLHQSNAGPGAARECGRLVAQGEYIQYLDSDDLLLPKKFERQVRCFKEGLNVDVVYGKTERRDYSSSKPLNSDLVAWKQTGEKHLTMFPAFLRHRWWGTSTPLYSRMVSDKAGHWLTIINEEDWEYDARIASFGGKLAYVDDFISIQQAHDQHLSSSGSTNQTKLRHRCIAREQIYFHAKNYTQLKSAPSSISTDDWLFFSQSVFLLARHCALAGLASESRNMTLLSMRALGRPVFAQCLFLISAHVFGWNNTARLLKRMGK